MTKEKHEHAYRLHTHVDGCHWHKSIYVCECGETKVIEGERDFHDPDDPYAAVWMVDGCDRCQALWLGEKPKVKA